MSKEPTICIREMLASAVNAPDLMPGCHAIGLLGALGAAGHNRYFDNADGRIKARLTPAGTAQINPTRRMAALLERAKFGVDRASVRPAVLLFADYLRRRPEYAHWRIDDGEALIVRFSARVVFEWLHDRCAQCGGGGQIPIGKIIGRSTRTKTCGVCMGNGAAKIDHPIRARFLGVSKDIYVRHWTDRFMQAHGWLAAIDESVIKPLRMQLKSGMLRPTSAQCAGASQGQPQVKEPLPPGVDRVAFARPDET
jgi:hypothetical protein